jgi:hypothetical protein
MLDVNLRLILHRDQLQFFFGSVLSVVEEKFEKELVVHMQAVDLPPRECFTVPFDEIEKRQLSTGRYTVCYNNACISDKYIFLGTS